MLPSVGGGSAKTVSAARPRSGLNIGNAPPSQAGGAPHARSGLAATGTPPRPTRKPTVGDIVKGPPESINWQSSGSITGGATPNANASPGRPRPQHLDGRPPKPLGAATPEPAASGHSPRMDIAKASTPGPRGSSRAGSRMSLRRARLDTPTASLVDPALPGWHSDHRSGAVVPNYRVDDLDGAWDVGKPGALAKWPAQKGSQPTLVPADGRRSRQNTAMATEGTGQVLPALDASAPASSFLAHVTKHLAFELRHVPSHEGTAGRLKVAREAFDMLVEGFPSYGPVLATVQAHYEARIDALEDDMARYEAAERTVQEERERAIAVQDASKNEVALAKAEADGERRRAAAAEHKSSEDDARLRRRIDQLEGDLEDARRDAAQERAARREADSNTDTYRAMYNLLKSQWDNAKAEVAQFRAEATEAVGALERDKRVAEGALANAEKKFSAERQELAAQLEGVKAASLTTEQAEQMHEDSAKLREVLKRLQAKLDWTTREMERRKQFEVPVQWAAFGRPELMRLKDAGVDSHTIVMRVLHDHDRSVAAEAALRARLHALSSIASAVESGPLVACLPPAPGGKTKRHVATGGGTDEDDADVAVTPLTEAADPWAPKSWLNCDVSPHGPLSLLPPSVHQHRAVRQWACAALFASAATGQPDLGAAFEKACGEHCDFRTVSPFFTAVVFRLRTTFAGDPLLHFFVSLLTRRRNAIAHAHQAVLAVRCALRAWEHVDKALSGRVTGRLPRDALLGAFASAFPLKTAAQLLALRQAVFEQLDGTMCAGGFVGPDGSIHVNAPPPATANDPELTAKADDAEKGSSSSLTSGGGSDDAVPDKPVISGFDAFSEADSDAPPPTKVLKPTPWHAIASIAYPELFGPSDLTASGRASPLLVELCVQYEQDVARGEGALEARLSSASDGAGRFEHGVPEVRTFLGAWALHRRFAAELVLGTPPTLAGEEEIDPSDGEACAMPPAPNPGDAESPVAPSKSMHRSSRSLSRSMSRSFGGTALERALRGLSAAVPHSGILAPERFAAVVTAALGADVAGSQAARLVPSPTTGAMPVALGMRLIPDAASAGPEAAAPRAVLRPAAAAGAGAGDSIAEGVEPRPPSEEPVTARAVVEAACRVLPVSGTFLVRCAAKSYMVPPAVFHSFADAYTAGIDLASALHYDVARGGKPPAPAPTAASPTKAGGPASPNKARR